MVFRMMFRIAVNSDKRMENDMFRISKILNHNAVLAVSDEKRNVLFWTKELVLVKKVSEYIEISTHATVYSLQETTERGMQDSLPGLLILLCWKWQI